MRWLVGKWDLPDKVVRECKVEGGMDEVREHQVERESEAWK